MMPVTPGMLGKLTLSIVSAELKQGESPLADHAKSYVSIICKGNMKQT